MAVDVQCDRCRRVFFWSAFSRGSLPRRGDIYCGPCATARDDEARSWRARVAERQARGETPVDVDPTRGDHR